MGVSMWHSGERNELSPKQSLFNSLRLVRLQDVPVRDVTNSSVWHTKGRFQPPSAATIVPIRIFSRVPPEYRPGDDIYVVYRGRIGDDSASNAECWEGLTDRKSPVIARINSFEEISSNRWSYRLSVVGFDCLKSDDKLSPFIETLASDVSYTGLNLCETENLDTGLLGNGLDISALTSEGADSYLAPVPNGTLVLALPFQTGNETLFLFQYSNQTQYTFASHLIATLSDQLDYGQTGTVNVGGADITVSCPLLRSGESIPGGTEVVVSRNLKTGAWQIIEAQCPGS